MIKRIIALFIFPLLSFVVILAMLTKGIVAFLLLTPLNWVQWQAMAAVRRLVWWAIKDQYMRQCDCPACQKERNEL